MMQTKAFCFRHVVASLATLDLTATCCSSFKLAKTNGQSRISELSACVKRETLQAGEPIVARSL